MAVVNGSAGNDLIHVAGDGVVAPPGFTDIPQATDFFDTLYGLGGNDVIYGGVGSDDIDGGDGDDVVYGGDHVDVIYGGNGNDTLVGGLDQDTLVGGAGVDTIRYDGTVGVVLDLHNCRGYLGDAEGDVIFGIETVEGTLFGDSLRGSAAAETLRGRGGDDLLLGRGGSDGLSGGDGDDELWGQAGADRLVGGAGKDTIGYLGSPAGVTVNLAARTASGGDAQGDVIGADIEAVAGSEYADILTGSAVANSLFGRAGNDILRGGAGADVIDGGDGVDLLTFYGATAAVQVDLTGVPGHGGDAEGDTYSGIENVSGGKAGDFLRGSAADSVLNGYEGNDELQGHDGADTLLGGVGDDLLQGDAGADRIDGSTGIDTIAFDVGAGVTVDLGTGACSGGHAQGDVISGIESIRGTLSSDDALTGSSGANRLEGRGGNDVLSGLGGSDTLIGDAGNDLLRGGGGDDVLSVDDGADVLEGGAGRDTLVFASAMVADFQALVFDPAIGGDSWQSFEVIQGSAGSDVIRAGDWGAAMELRGGTGDDVLATGINGVIADTLSGEAGNDQLDGGAGDDVLRGGVGADLLAGAAGSDTASYYGGATGVLVSLSSGTGSGGEAQGDALSGIENLSGSQGGDSLYGNAGANVLQGWNGNDILIGRAGKDTLTGGAGADRFQFTVLADSVAGANADRITDFSHAQGDRIDLAAIDARFTVAGDQAFSFIGTAAFTGVAGQLHYWHDSGRTIVSGDVNGNGTADFNIVLTGSINLVAGDFVL